MEADVADIKNAVLVSYNGRVPDVFFCGLEIT